MQFDPINFQNLYCLILVAKNPFFLQPKEVRCIKIHLTKRQRSDPINSFQNLYYSTLIAKNINVYFDS